MLTFHNKNAGRPVSWGRDVAALPPDVNWVDASSPDRDEVDFLQRALGVEVPALEKMVEIETSSRLYRIGDNLYLTIPVAGRREDGGSRSTPLGLVVTKEVLLTVHFEPVKICDSPRLVAPGGDRALVGGIGALISLVEGLVDHIADELESVTERLDQHSQAIFVDRPGGAKRWPSDDDRNLRGVLVRIGQVRGFTSRISETLLVVTRMARYVASEAAAQLKPDERVRLDRLAGDAASLSEHETRLSEKIQFLLDASLGLISADQNDIFKILTMVSVVGIPPTLLASMYGMNFKSMPEYDWTYGYAYGLTVILLSGLIPLLWFKWRRWW